jgi:hypothetical protein
MNGRQYQLLFIEDSVCNNPLLVVQNLNQATATLLEVEGEDHGPGCSRLSVFPHDGWWSVMPSPAASVNQSSPCYARLAWRMGSTRSVLMHPPDVSGSVLGDHQLQSTARPEDKCHLVGRV